MLAHRGVLFLDELSEFRRDGLQALRGPLEDGSLTIVRARWTVTYPSRFQLVAASNPCPCGARQDPVKECTCPPGAMAAFRERLSGPILDRIDLRVQVQRPTRFELFHAPDGEPSRVVRARIATARETQSGRLAAFGVSCNAEIPTRSLADACRMSAEAAWKLEESVESYALSARAAHRTLRVARTVADLRGREAVTVDEIDEARGFRVLDGD